MEPTDEKKPEPPFDPLEDRKTNAPREMAQGLSARDAALMWGTNSNGVRRRPPYSVTE